MAEALAMTLAMEAVIDIGPALTLGDTPSGKQRMVPITGGRFSGALSAQVVSGGADWQTLRPDGVTEIHAIYAIRADDGSTIRVDNRGLAAPGEGGSHLRRTVCRFEAPAGPHDWVNRAMFVGSLEVEPSREAIRLRLYRLV